jgi:Uma2 family endonuclease
MTTLAPFAVAPPIPPATVTPPDTVVRHHFDNAAEWHRALGGVPLERIIFDPPPGTATEADLLRFVEGGDRLCELIDGTLVEKPMGFTEGQIAMRLGARLTLYADDHDLGIVAGADSTLRMKSGRVRLLDLVFVSYERLPGKVLPPEKVPTLTADLAVEVLSEGNTVAEIAQKLRELF